MPASAFMWVRVFSAFHNDYMARYYIQHQSQLAKPEPLTLHRGIAHIAGTEGNMSVRKWKMLAKG